MAIVQNILTIAMPATDAPALDRQSDDSCLRAAHDAWTKLTSGLWPMIKPMLAAKLSLYVPEHPEIVTDVGSNLCPSGAGPSITGPLGTEVTELSRSFNAFWSTYSPEMQSMWTEYSTVEGVSSEVQARTDICPSFMADITGTPRGATATHKGAAPRETGAVKMALGIAGMVMAAL